MHFSAPVHENWSGSDVQDTMAFCLTLRQLVCLFQVDCGRISVEIEEGIGLETGPMHVRNYCVLSSTPIASN